MREYLRGIVFDNNAWFYKYKLTIDVDIVFQIYINKKIQQIIRKICFYFVYFDVDSDITCDFHILLCKLSSPWCLHGSCSVPSCTRYYKSFHQTHRQVYTTSGRPNHSRAWPQQLQKTLWVRIGKWGWKLCKKKQTYIISVG